MEKEQLFLFLDAAKETGLSGDYEILLTLAYSGMCARELILTNKILESPRPITTQQTISLNTIC